jgi:purine-binding chemotaxis protein CheW
MTAAEVTEVTDERQVDAGGKYLTFGLADEIYGLEILKVREIIGMMDITSVPRTPEEVVGVINLRGNVIPIIDLRLKFGMPREARTEETCMIVVDVNGLQMGVVVDRVLEVLDIAAGGIQDAPSFGVDVDTDFILGIGKAGDRVTILLDIARVLNTAAARRVAEAQAGSEERES